MQVARVWKVRVNEVNWRTADIYQFSLTRYQEVWLRESQNNGRVRRHKVLEYSSCQRIWS